MLGMGATNAMSLIATFAPSIFTGHPLVGETVTVFIAPYFQVAQSNPP